MLDFLGSIMAYPFRWIDSISPNYVVTLILFAVFMKLLLFPFGIKQQKNSIKQAKLRPYENIIRKKYQGRKDKVSQQKLNEEIMQLYQQENFNPASGCLPLLLQLPIIFALYQVIIKPATFLLQLPKEILTQLSEVAKAVDGGALTEIIQINKLLHLPEGTSAEVTVKVNEFLSTAVTVKGDATTVGDAFSELLSDFTVFGINLMDNPDIKVFNLLVLVPVLVFIFSWGSMKLTRKFTYQPQANDNATAASMKMMDLTMPAMSAFICFGVPAGIGIYWIIQNILGVVQQYVLYKLYPIPPVTEEDIREAELRLKGRSKKDDKDKKRAALSAEKAESTPLKKSGKGVKHGKNSQNTGKVVFTSHAKARVKEMNTVPKAVRRLK